MESDYNLDATEKLKKLPISAVEEILLLIQQGANPNAPLNEKDQEGNETNYRPIQAAIIKKRNDLLLLLLERGADPNTCYSNTVSILAHAACVENVEAITSLLNYGANPKYRDSKGTIALDCAFHPKTKQVLTMKKFKIA
jgi:ankyrin repeat protein